MKLPSKYIALLVIASLTGIFAYQAYWLTGLYRTMRSEMERGITEAMRMSDYNEMMMRVGKLSQDDTDHGEVSVSAGYSNNEGKSLIHSSTTVSRKGFGEDTTLHKTFIPQADSMSLSDSDSSPQAALRSKEGLDIVSDPDVVLYDSLLTSLLHSRNIHLPHRLLHLYESRQEDSTVLFTDTLAMLGTPGYVPTSKAVAYNYAFDMHAHHSYRLLMEPIHTLVLRQMSGILATSFIILVILSFSFGFLIRTILKQKTLEEMKSDFTNNITHELKTPIAVAYAANDALLHFNLAEDKKQRDKYLGICQEQLQRLSGLVEQILSMSMERRKSFRLRPETICLNELLHTLVEQHKLKAEKPTDITLDIVPQELTLTADRTHFGNILSNLMDNAIKYSPDRAIVTIRCRKRDGQQVEISFTDHGIGIPADKLPHIFDKFYRVPTGNIHNTKGYGLGLFYVKTMLEKHGGHITVQSEPGKGSTFTLTL